MIDRRMDERTENSTIIQKANEQTKIIIAVVIQAITMQTITTTNTKQKEKKMQTKKFATW